MYLFLYKTASVLTKWSCNAGDFWDHLPNTLVCYKHKDIRQVITYTFSGFPT